MPRIRPARRPSDHAHRTRGGGRMPREVPVRLPTREPVASGASHGEDAGPQADGAPPREDRAG